MAQSIVIVVVILLELFWFIQLIHLMSQEEKYFSGKYDKLCWVAVLLFANVIGAFAYFILNPLQYWLKSEYKKTIVEDYPEPCVKCGKTIPPNTTKCPHCGWSYNDEKK